MSIKKFAGHPAPMILVYGSEGSGKTSFSLAAPSPIYLPIVPEAPPRNLTPDAFDGVSNFMDVMAALRQLFQAPGEYRTLVLDSLSALEPLVWTETCRRNKWKDIETPGFGRGYVAADDVWRDLFHACRALGEKRGIMTIFVAHADSAIVDEPGLPPFRKYTVRLHKRGEAIATQGVDAILFLHTKVTIKSVDTGFNRKETYAEGGNVRWLAADGRAHYVAKNRFDLPEMVMVDKANPWACVEAYITLPNMVEPELPLTAPVEPGIAFATAVADKLSKPVPPSMSELVEKYEPQVNPPSTAEETSAALGGDTVPI